MKHPLFMVPLLCGLLLAGAARQAAAQQGPPASPVAIIDISYIFKNHIRFKQMKEDLRRTVEAAETDLKARRDEAERMQEDLKRYNAGSQEYKALEEEIANKIAKLQADVQLRKKGFVEAEAKMYYNVYQEIIQEVNHVARGRYALVLRFNGEQIDRSNLDPQRVMQGLNKVVLYHDGVDITPHVLTKINQRAGNPGNTGARPNTGFPRR